MNKCNWVRGILRACSFKGYWESFIGIVQKVFSLKGVPRIFDAFLTQF